MKSARFVVLAIVAAILALVAAPPTPTSAATMIVDTNLDDVAITLTACTLTDNDCSLRGAITNANGAGTPGDIITFHADDFPVGTPGVITIAGGLPGLSDGGDTIDATGRGVVIDGTFEPIAGPCLALESAGNVIKGLQITDCTHGVLIGADVGNVNTVGPDNVIFDNTNGVSIAAGAANNVIKGNKIGTNAAGTAVHPDGGNGIGINVNASINTIGSGAPADRNIISGNTTGVSISGTTSNNNVVRGNFIGTDVTGTLDVGNAASGINLAAAVSGNIIGGTAAGEGNVISGNNGSGVRFFGFGGSNPSSNTVQGNLIGTEVSGTADLGNTLDGIVIDGGIDNCIGGTIIASVCTPAAGARNIISGNDSGGVQILGAGATGNVALGNYIGTDATGTVDLGNSSFGINLEVGSSNTIGGASAGAGNVISGNNNNGVRISGSNSNTVQGNLIGTAANGTAPLGNLNQNVRIENANNNTIAGNVIADSLEVGIFVLGTTSGNMVLGNFIGTDASGTVDLGNASHGVHLLSASTTVGSVSASDANVIAYNGGDGVRVDGTGGASASPNTIRGNSIHSNTGKGIENFMGGNGEFPPPVITSAGSAAGTSTCSSPCAVDVYSDNAEEGRIYHGSTMTIGSTGNWSFAGAVVGPNVTATVTIAGQTSEFSASPFACADNDNDDICDSGDPDDDNDSWTDVAEVYITTNPLLACTPHGWPPDPQPGPFGDGEVQIDDITFAAGAFDSITTPRAEIASQNNNVQIDDIAAFAGRFNTVCTP